MPIEINVTIPWRIIPKKRHYRRRQGGGLYLSEEYKQFQNACLEWFWQ